jgi:hypothetical protein
MYAYAAAGGTHTYTHIAQSTAAGGAEGILVGFYLKLKNIYLT